VPTPTSGAALNPTPGAAGAPGRGLDPRDRRLIEVLRGVAPGTALRDGLDRIIAGRRGALIVLGWAPDVERLVTGGIALHEPFTPQLLAELAKMDGAIVLDDTARTIVHANAQLMPDAAVPTTETGTRHRTAERVSVQLDRTVLSLSASTRTVTVYSGRRRHLLEPAAAILERANQALAALARLRDRFDRLAEQLTAHELDGTVQLADACALVQLAERLLRLSEQLRAHVIELGVDGRLLDLQHHDIAAGVVLQRDLLVRDYAADEIDADDVVHALHDDDAAPASVDRVGHVLGHDPSRLAATVEPRGHRALRHLGLDPHTAAALIRRAGPLTAIAGRSVPDLVHAGLDRHTAERLRHALHGGGAAPR